MMTKTQEQYVKLKTKFQMLDNHREADMISINIFMDRLLDMFSEEIVWDNLHNINKDTDMYRLQQIVKLVRNVTTRSNQDATAIINDE